MPSIKEHIRAVQARRQYKKAPPQEEPILVSFTHDQYDALAEIIATHRTALGFLPQDPETARDKVISREIDEAMLSAYTRSHAERHSYWNRANRAYPAFENPRHWIIEDTRIIRVLVNNGYDVRHSWGLWYETTCNKIQVNEYCVFPDGSIIESMGTQLYLIHQPEPWRD